MSEPRLHRGPGKTMRHHVFKPGDMVRDVYRVEHVIAAGGMAEVYLAVDTRTGDRRALKTLNDRYAEDPKIMDRLVREFDVLRKKPDPSLVQVFECGVARDRFFYVMEYLDGFTLRELMVGRRMPLGVALSLTKQLAIGLHLLHRVGIVHRDVKPDNLIVLEAPGSPEHHAKLIDLGIAKQPEIRTTSGTAALGTVAYMAPEQTQGERVDGRADVYAVCLILYEMLAKVHAMAGESAPKGDREWIQRQREREAIPLSSLGIGVDPIVSNIVQRGLAKHPAQRFDSAADLAMQLQSAMNVLEERGDLGDRRLHPFGPYVPGVHESGPQPQARVLPPGVSVPTAGLPYRRTDEPELAPPPVKISPEPPRVVAHDNQKTVRGTTKMLGRRGTVPHLGSPAAMIANNPAPPPAPPVAPVPTLAPSPIAAPPPSSAPPEPERAPETPAAREPEPRRPSSPPGVTPPRLAKPKGLSDAPSGPGWKFALKEPPLRTLEPAPPDDPTVRDKIIVRDLGQARPRRRDQGPSQATFQVIAVLLGLLLALFVTIIVLLVRRQPQQTAAQPTSGPATPQIASTQPDRAATQQPTALAPQPSAAPPTPAPTASTRPAPAASARTLTTTPRPASSPTAPAASSPPPAPLPTPKPAPDRLPDAPKPASSGLAPIFDSSTP